MTGIPYTEVTPLAQVHQKLAEQGFAIIDEHRLPEELCDAFKDEVWQALEAIIGGPEEKRIRRDDVNTYKNYFALGQLHSMMLQYFGFAQMPCCWEARQRAAPIFGHLWGVGENDLLTSMDALSFNIAPENFTPKRGYFRGNTWWHTDQAIIKNGDYCIQGFYNCCETGDDDGCLSVLEGSHLYHGELRQRFHAATPDKELRDNWYKLTAEETAFFEQEKGCQWRFVCPPKGCFVVWNSKTIHMGTEPRLPREGARDRLVIYVCMLPKMATNYRGLVCDGVKPRDIDKRRNAFLEQRTTTHWPYPMKLFPKKPRFMDGNIVVNSAGIPRKRFEDMTQLQRSLLGNYKVD